MTKDSNRLPYLQDGLFLSTVDAVLLEDYLGDDILDVIQELEGRDILSAAICFMMVGFRDALWLSKMASCYKQHRTLIDRVSIYE